MTDRLPGVKFALFAAVCVVAAAWVVSVTGNFRWMPFVTPMSTYDAELRDATGLRVGDDVRLSGVPVGRVQHVDVEQGTPVVTFRLREEVQPTDTWEVGPRWRNVTGQRYLYLYDTGGGQPLEPGDRIPVERSRVAANIDRFLAQITPLLRAIDPEAQNDLTAALNTALIGREQRVQELVADLGSLSREVADTRPELETVLDEAGALLAEYNRREEELDAFIGDLAQVSGTLRARNDELLGAVSDVAEVQRRFGDFLRDNDAHLRGLIDDTAVLVGSIGDQLEDFEGSVATFPEGFATYMLISRWGEWFNVRSVAVMAAQGDQVLYCQTEGGTDCNPPNLAGGQETSGQPNAVSEAGDADLTSVAHRSLGERRGARWGEVLRELSAQSTAEGRR